MPLIVHVGEDGAEEPDMSDAGERRPPAAARDPIKHQALQLLCRIDALSATRGGMNEYRLA